MIRNSIIPFGPRYGAINLFGILFAKPSMVLDDTVINHERIHTRQMRELLYIPFYIIYVAEWLIRLCRYRFDTYKAYLAISFEREAYDHASDPAYLTRRRCYAQWRQ